MGVNEEVTLRRIWPGDGGPVGDAELERLYAYPDGPKWLAVNFVSSADGAATIDGRSGGLGTAADRAVFRLGSDLADLVLVGAGTAVVEGYDGAHPDEETARRRREHGLAPITPVAVVTTGRALAPDAPVLTKALVPTIVVTSEQAPPALREAWAAAGARVLVAGTTAVDLRQAVGTLTEWGYRRIDCEGGPRLFGSLLDAGLVDELRLTVSPLLVAGASGRIAASAGIDHTDLALASVLTDGSTLLLRYLVKP
ncbi:pyrimidine reductase family protein [Amycolatopsis samaneae]|uniref:Pyrimidine reductase family protein n=1 Tax=Amycolatopsis samaneae TaxID=664691 RepID=A0ABW5GLL6_9PSEU